MNPAMHVVLRSSKSLSRCSADVERSMFLTQDHSTSTADATGGAGCSYGNAAAAISPHACQEVNRHDVSSHHQVMKLPKSTRFYC